MNLPEVRLFLIVTAGILVLFVAYVMRTVSDERWFLWRFHATFRTDGADRHRIYPPAFRRKGYAVPTLSRLRALERWAKILWRVPAISLGAWLMAMEIWGLSPWTYVLSGTAFLGIFGAADAIAWRRMVRGLEPVDIGDAPLDEPGRPTSKDRASGSGPQPSGPALVQQRYGAPAKAILLGLVVVALGLAGSELVVYLRGTVGVDAFCGDPFDSISGGDLSFQVNGLPAGARVLVTRLSGDTVGRLDVSKKLAWCDALGIRVPSTAREEELLLQMFNGGRVYEETPISFEASGNVVWGFGPPSPEQDREYRAIIETALNSEMAREWLPQWIQRGLSEVATTNLAWRSSVRIPGGSLRVILPPNQVFRGRIEKDALPYVLATVFDQDRGSVIADMQIRYHGFTGRIATGYLRVSLEEVNGTWRVTN